MHLYRRDARESNLTAVAFYLAFLLTAQAAQIGGSIWLKQWSEINQRFGSNPDVGKYIGIYFAFGFGAAFLVVLQTLILWIFCSIEVSISPLHIR